MQKVMQLSTFGIVLTLLTCLTYASSFLTVRLPQGVFFDLPKNWIVFSENKRITLNAFVESMFERKQEIGFTASLQNDRGQAIAIVQTYYWKTSAGQEDVRNMSAHDVKYYDQEMYKDLIWQLGKMDGTIKKWMGTSKQIQNGLTTLISEYVRSSPLIKGHFNVRILRIYCGAKSVSFVASYHQEQQFPLRAILDKVISTFRYQGCDAN